MADEEALDRLVLGSTSFAEDLSFQALVDVSRIISEKEIEDARVIGGHMVTLHVQRWRLGRALYRATLDADLGVPPVVARTARIVEALEDLGYTRYTGNRYRKEVADLRGRIDENFAVVDVLIPAYTSRARENIVVDDKLTTIEVPGLALALRTEPVVVQVDLSMLEGEGHRIELRLPDERCSLVLKGLAWRQRGAAKDIVDVWRLLEVTAAAGLTLDAGLGRDATVASESIRSAFSDLQARGTQALVSELNLAQPAAREQFGRIRALLDRVLAV